MLTLVHACILSTQIMPTGQIGQESAHREVLPAFAPEVFNQQDLDTDTS